MRRIRYSVAMSLDGYIAGPQGEADWIPMDQEIDFNAIFTQFDTILVGRRTFHGMVALGRTSIPGMKTLVFSRTLKQEDHPEVTVVAEGHREMLAALKARSGKDIWLFGGGSLFRSLSKERLVDTVEVAVIPVLLGAGVKLLASPANRINLSLTAHRIYRSGRVSLEYAVTHPSPA